MVFKSSKKKYTRKKTKTKSKKKKKHTSKKKKSKKKNHALSAAEIKLIVEELQTKGVKIYAPVKYFSGLTSKRAITKRYNEMLTNKLTSKSNYSPFSTDSNKKTKVSSYTKEFYMRYPDAKSLSSKSEVTGIPLSIINKVYNKGLAAWRTGHRVGATQQQWGYARVHSFIMGGCTLKSADKSLYENAIKIMLARDIRAWRNRFIGCQK